MTMHEMKRTAGISGDSVMGVNVQRWKEQASSTAIADLFDSSTRLLKSLPPGKEV